VSAALLAAAGRALGREVESASTVGGGDINRAWRLELAGGGAAFLKSRPDAPEDEFGAEAAGLRWLAEPGGLAVPEVLAVIDEGEERGLALEWIEPGRLGDGGAEELGRGLALVHSAGAGGFNALPPGSPRRTLRFGGVEVPVAAGASWPEVYGTRLRELVRVARDRGRVAAGTADAVDSVVKRLDELAGPPEPPARIHGDLWSGNVLAGADGRPWLIDPAAHGAHREMDLAMLELFGSVPVRAERAYSEVSPLADGWRERLDLWQIQPLLVHAILFGGSYGHAAERAARAYL
jgi:fructosamine-3-kinase